MIHRLLRFFVIPTVVAVWALSAAPPAPAQTGAPDAPVTALSAVLLEVMQNADALGFAGREARLDPVLRDTFAFEDMARLVLGPVEFDALDPATRARYVDAFARMSVAIFAGRFDGYSGQQFTDGGTQEIRPGQVLVTSILSAPDRDSVNLDYLMRQVGGDWRVLDVFLDRRVSEVARQRAEFAAVFQRGGIEGLLTEIEANITRQRTGG